jgi:predicted branched-subunit amino acid permease
MQRARLGFPRPSRTTGSVKANGSPVAQPLRVSHNLSPVLADPRSAEPAADFRSGARAMVPIVVAYTPIALLVGAQVAASSDPVAAWLGTWLIYGGAAHLAVLDVLGAGSGWVTGAIVGLLVNLRLAAFATAMHPDWRSAPVRVRVAAAVMLTDAPWALARNRTSGVRHHYLGAAVTLFVLWPVLVSVGVLVGGGLGEAPVTSLLLPLTLGALVVPQLRQRPAAVAILAASCCAVLTIQVSAGVALALTGVVGALAGALAVGLVGAGTERQS